MRTRIEQQFDRDYIHVRELLVSGKISATSAKVWLRERAEKIADLVPLECKTVTFRKRWLSGAGRDNLHVMDDDGRLVRRFVGNSDDD